MKDSKYHLNTKYMKPSQQLASGPYQYLKSQLSQQNYFNPRYIDKSNDNNRDDAMGELNKLMAGQESIDHSKLAHIHSIKLHPIVNENFISSFDENQYRLDPQDKVKIVKEKVFRIQNYYNYLYELKSEKQHQKLQQKTQDLLKRSKHDQEQHQTSPKFKHSPQKNFKGPADSIVDNYKHHEEEHMPLAPEYTKYEEKIDPTQKYFLKEKDRKKIQESMYKRF